MPQTTVVYDWDSIDWYAILDPAGIVVASTRYHPETDSWYVYISDPTPSRFWICR